MPRDVRMPLMESTMLLLLLFGGWSGAVNVSADAKVKDAAYDFFSFMDTGRTV